MSRFLTPSKICLVVLIEIYRTYEVPASNSIALLSFISSHTIRRHDDANSGAPSTIAAQSSASLKDFKAILLPLQSKVPGRSLYDVFTHHLWSFTSFDQLGTFLEQSVESPPEGSITRIPIGPFSPLGQFIRRCNLEFVRLQFGDAYRLWEELVLYREPSHNTWAIRHPEEAKANGPYGSDPNPALGQEGFNASPALLEQIDKRRGANHPCPSSQDDFERTIHFQLEQLQSFGCRVPDEMKDKLQDMISQASSIPPDVHFIRFFDAWRSGAYANAVDHLHRYFDYAMEGYVVHQDVKTYHQYALLHLAVLHADFGCYDEAIAAMNECIATARENQDARCLNFGLSWLVHLRKAHPDYAEHEAIAQGTTFAGSETDILTFLQQRAIENKDWVQLSSSLLTQAEAEIRTGGSIAKAVEMSYQAGHLNGKYGLKGLEPTQLRLQGSLFARLGNVVLAEQYYSVVQNVHNTKASKPEMLSLICLQAYHRALSGRYDEALDILTEHDPTHHKTLRMDNIFLGFAIMIRFRRAMHRNETFAAESLLRQLKPIRKFADPDIVFETHVLEIEWLQRQGELATAFEKIAELITETKEKSGGDISHRIRLLILKANIWARAGRAPKGFSIALRAASSAHRALLLPVLWEAIAALATIMIDLGEFEAAKSIIEAIMPQALEGGNLYLVAQLHDLRTDAYVGLAGHACKDGSKERGSMLSSALGVLERAKDAYSRVEDLDGILGCLEKKARLFRFRGDHALAEEMEKMFDQASDKARQRENEIRGINA